MYKSIFFSIVALFVCISSINSQTSAKTETSDPKAKGILDKLKEKYDKATSIKAQFKLTSEYPDQKPDTKTGTMLQKGEKYNLSLTPYQMICDGTTLWVVNSKTKETQINSASASKSDKILSPQQVLKLYQTGEYIYLLTFDGKKGAKNIQEIEFKPVSKKSEYSKLRVTIDKTSGQINEVKAFGKDGSRHTLAITSVNMKEVIAASAFKYDSAKYPGYHVEDLRID